jgi:1-acyl-sn-glycerol-3-phosphate acyltransferase
VTSAVSALLRGAAVRRAITVPVVGAGAAVLGSSVGLWAPAAFMAGLVRPDHRFRALRLLSFAFAWTSLESVGVAASTVLWATGRSSDRDAHYALQRWWAARLVDALGVTAGLKIEVAGLDALGPGPVVLCARHVSIADSLLPAWLLGQLGMRPRYVMKDDLLIDPCLDIVGGRLPNHFIDREPDDSGTELKFLETLADGMGSLDAAVVFPEGMVVSEARRQRAIARVEQRDPARTARVHALTCLAPVRPSGTAALLRGAPDADIVFVTHTGFERLASLATAPAQIPLADPVRVDIRRVPRSEVPDSDGFAAWFDEEWVRCDRRTAELAHDSEIARTAEVGSA